jgi:arylsulfatase
MECAEQDVLNDVSNPGGFSGETLSYTYARLYNLFLDPKETHSYLVRKLPYTGLFSAVKDAHLATYKKYPSNKLFK